MKFLNLLIFLFVGQVLVAQAPVVSGTQETWHKVTLTYTSSASYTETTGTNPFRDRRLIVTFTGPSSQTYEVHGYFAADGNAAETSANSGNKWKVHFVADEPGTWTYTTSFRSGTDIAAEYPINSATGSALDFNGESGSIIIAASTASVDSHKYKGQVRYVPGSRYLQHAGTGEAFLKIGMDSPETMLCYEDFDNTIAGRNDPTLTEKVKTWEPHQIDYDAAEASSYTWQSGKGTEMLGMLKYIQRNGMNAISFIPITVTGDGDNVWPWAATAHASVDTPTTDAANQMMYDCSKLDQWGRIFDYATDLNIFLHFKLQETENGSLLGGLTAQRKIYYKEMIARYGHNLALNWNVGEENVNTDLEVQQFADYLDAIDPYGHNITIHTYPNQISRYANWDGPTYDLTGASMQNPMAWFENTASGEPANHERIYTIVNQAIAAGKHWAVAMDEQVNATTGAAADADYTAYLGRGTIADNIDEIMTHVFWGTFMAGGYGSEIYYGYQTGTTDLTAEDHRSRDEKWPLGDRTLDFFRQTNLKNFTQDSTIVTGGAWALKYPGEEYIVYLQNGGTQSITTTSGPYNLYWYDPRNGGNFLQTATKTLSGGSSQSLGAPPNNTTQAWVAYLRKNPISYSASSNSVVQAARAGASISGATTTLRIGSNKVRIKQEELIGGGPVTDSILALSPIVWWDDDDIPGTVDGDVVSSWTDRILGQSLTTYVAPPNLELVGAERAVRFDDTDCLSVNEFAQIDFTGHQQELTIIVQLGNDVGTNGTLLSKQESAYVADFQIQTNSSANGLLGVNAFSENPSSADGYFGGYSLNATTTGSPAHQPYDFFMIQLGKETQDIAVYRNDEQLYEIATLYDFHQGTRNGTEPLRCGCRGDGLGGLGYTFDGSIKNILIFDKKLNHVDWATIRNNL